MSSESTVEPTEDPIAYFIEDIGYHGRSERTRTAYGRVLRRFESFLSADRSATLSTASQRDCMAFVDALRSEVGESTVATYASYLHRFYAYMTSIDAFEGNPMALVVAEMDESIDTDPARRDLTVAEMRSFVATVGHPMERAVVVTLLKTGMRVGELCNLDLRDVSLADLSIDLEVDPRPSLHGKPRSLYVDSEPTRGSSYNGEPRTASNKRKRATVVPVDDELASVLEAWLAVRPDARSSAEPLFCSTGDDWGGRLTTDMAYTVVVENARAMGWHESGNGRTGNVTPHYFRHFFTTHLRDRTGERGIVKYLRGDVASDVIDTYTHNWGDRVRDVYEREIYEVLE